jgi:4-amino-4-deoxy-L-arabinose transferase-like glycosyltransferase
MLLLAIIVVGFLLRLAGLVWGQAYRDSNLFDELSAYENTLKFIAGDEQTRYLGQPHFAGGNVPGPLWVILWSIPFRMGGTDAVVLTMILLNTAVIYLTYRLALALFSERTALWAAALCATSPWAIYESVGKCNPQVMAFFGALLYLALWQVVTKPRSPHICWVCIVLAMMPQFHMFAVFLVPGTLCLLWQRRREMNWQWMVAGLFVSSLLYLPYIWGEAHHGWQNTQAIFTADTPKTAAALKVFTMPIVVLSNLISSMLGNKDYQEFGRSAFGSFAVLAAFNIVSLGLVVLSMINFLSAGKRPRRPFRADKPEIFVSVLLLGPLLIFLLTGHNFASRYTLVLYPLLFLLPAHYLMENSAPRRWLKTAQAAMVATMVFNVVLMLALFRYEGQRIARAGYFIASFHKMEQARQALRADAGNGCGIHLDGEFVAGEASNTEMGNPETRGLVGLSRYININEPFDPSAKNAACEKLYRILPPGKGPATNDRVVYRDNGLTVIDAEVSTNATRPMRPHVAADLLTATHKLLSLRTFSIDVQAPTSARNAPDEAEMVCREAVPIFADLLEMEKPT